MKIPKILFRSPRYFIPGENNNLCIFKIDTYARKLLNMDQYEIHNTIEHHIAGHLNGFFRSRIVLKKFRDNKRVLKVLKS